MAEATLDGSDDVRRPRARPRLRAAVWSAHERMHGHPGFTALANGCIGLADYRALLARLFGFHSALDAAADWPAVRGAALAGDLGALGVPAEAVASLPRCRIGFPLAEPAARLGARYVVEGAALGGRLMGRSLDRLIGPPGAPGRSFFADDGAVTARWTAFLRELETAIRTEGEAAGAADAARATFEAMENWMRGWREVAP